MKITAAPPQSEQIVRQLKEEIRRGRLKPGDRLESIRALAARFGVGRQVVLSAFTRLEQEDILVKQVGRGTFVRDTAAATGARPTVGFHVRRSSLAWFYNRSVFFGAAEQAERLGIQLAVLPGDAGEEAGKYCRRRGIDGLLATGEIDDEWIARLNAAKLPYLVLGTYQLGEPAWQLTFKENTFDHALRAALRDRPARRIAGITGNDAFFSTRRLLDSLLATAAEAGSRINPRDIISDPAEDGYAAMRQLMKRRPAPDLVFITGRAFPGAARYLFEHGPERPRIITPCDENRPLYPELVDYPAPNANEQLGAAGLELLAQFLRDGKPGKQIYYL